MARFVNHIAVSVTDIFQAMEWYRNVLGMSVLSEPVVVSAKGGSATPAELARAVSRVFGPKLGSFRICHMLSENGVGIELFEFIEPRAERRHGDGNFEFWKTGFFHLAITDRNIDALAEKIASTGGKRRTAAMELVPGSGKRICYCEDPFGNVIEIYSHSYESFWKSGKDEP